MKAIFKSLGSIMRVFKYGPRLRPTRDWLVLLSIFTILLITSVGWNLIQFSRVVKGEKIGDVQIAPPVEIHLDTVQALFEERAKERTNYQSQYRFVDPSL